MDSWDAPSSCEGWVVTRRCFEALFVLRGVDPYLMDFAPNVMWGNSCTAWEECPSSSLCLVLAQQVVPAWDGRRSLHGCVLQLVQTTHNGSNHAPHTSGWSTSNHAECGQPPSPGAAPKVHLPLSRVHLRRHLPLFLGASAFGRGASAWTVACRSHTWWCVTHVVGHDGKCKQSQARSERCKRRRSVQKTWKQLRGT